MNPATIRNFCIIAHVDHGKSTLADRLIEVTGAVAPREQRDQLLDSMDLERERGITIKASAVRLPYRSADGRDYVLNLLDTPGHVDFTYEVSKAIAASEGALLLVDVGQGVEAQTIANLYQARALGLVIIPIINKIDLARAEIPRVQQQMRDLLGVEEHEILLASAKLGTGVDAILERIVRDVPPPTGSRTAPLQALVFDSEFDTFRGVVIYVKVVNGALRPGMSLRMMSTGHTYPVEEVGVFRPQRAPTEELSQGEVGFVICNIRDAREVMSGETLTDAAQPAAAPLQAVRPLRPLVFSGLYPVNPRDFHALREALEKLRLSDGAFSWEPETSAAFGPGFRCGFLGLLHMEIIQERLEREHAVDLVLTTPSVGYRVQTTRGDWVEVDHPGALPPAGEMAAAEEPMVQATVVIPKTAMGPVMELAMARRGVYQSTDYVSPERVCLRYRMPLAEVIVDFYDKIKSVTRGYGSLDYEVHGYDAVHLVRLDILINGERCDALSLLTPRDQAEPRGRALALKLKGTIPRHLFEVAIQAAIGGRVIARESVRPLGKHVTAKCYGGDITRKRKLWEKQKAGKRRMKQFGRVAIPQEAFLAVLKL